GATALVRITGRQGGRQSQGPDRSHHCPAFPKRARTGKRQSMTRHELIQPDRGQEATAIHLVNKDGLAAFAQGLSAPQRAALAGQKFSGAGYQVGIVPDGDGWFAVGGVKDPAALSSWCLAK